MVSKSRLHNILMESVHRMILTEDQESKSIAAAIKLLLTNTQANFDKEDADRYIRKTLREKVTALRDVAAKFILGVTRMDMEGELEDGNFVMKLNRTLEVVSSPKYIDKFNRDLNGLSAQQLVDQFEPIVNSNRERNRNNVSSIPEGELTGNDYEIVHINSFEEACEYNKYTYQDDQWCITYAKDNYDEYTKEGINQIYFCLKEGFEDMEPYVEEDAPMDEYGLSMISVIVDPDGELVYCTSRWNHSNGGDDKICQTPDELSRIVGADFYATFRPGNLWCDDVAEAEQRIASGEDLKNVFSEMREFGDGLILVKLANKYTLINQNGQFISRNLWFDRCGEFKEEGFAMITRGNKSNYIKPNGELLLPDYMWFNSSGLYSTGLRLLKIKQNGRERYNFIKPNGEVVFKHLLSWYDEYIYDGFIKIKNKFGKYNLISMHGDVLSQNQWFDDCGNFSRPIKGYVRVSIKGKGTNYIDVNCKEFFPIWFSEDCHSLSFYNGFARVRSRDDKCNYLNKNFELLYGDFSTTSNWFDGASDFNWGFGVVRIGEKYNYIGPDGNFLSKDLWFDKAYYMSDGMGMVEMTKPVKNEDGTDGTVTKHNVLTRDGKLLFDEWVDYCKNMHNGFVEIKSPDDNNTRIYVDKNGKRYTRLEFLYLTDRYAYYEMLDLDESKIRNVIMECVVNLIKKNVIEEEHI